MNKDSDFLNDSKLTELSIQLSKYPKTFSYWDALLKHILSKASPLSKSTDKALCEFIRSLYISLLTRFPFLENYHVEYALFEYRLGNFQKMHQIFEDALQCFNNRSMLLWIEYLRLCNKIIPESRQLFKKYETAASYIGLHFFSGEFWHLYIDEVKLRSKQQYAYIKILRKVLEIPQYHYAEFFDLWLQSIDEAKDLSQLRHFAKDEDLWKKLKVNTCLQGRKGPHLQYAKKTLRKITKEMYLVVQYQVMELFELFESKISQQYYCAGEKLISHQEIGIWCKYLEYTRKNKVFDLIKLQFQRALLPLAHYEEIWLMYSDFLVDDLNDYLGAKNILLQGLVFVHKKAKILDTIAGIMIRLGQYSELNELFTEMENAYSSELSFSEDFELFMDHLHFKMFLSGTRSKGRYSASRNIEISKEIIDSILSRMESEETEDKQLILLNLVNQMYERFPRNFVEDCIYKQIINNKWEYYLSKGSFWYQYCSLIWFDSSKSYLARRKHIIQNVIPLANNKGNDVVNAIKNFLETYIPDEVDR